MSRDFFIRIDAPWWVEHICEKKLGEKDEN